MDLDPTTKWLIRISSSIIIFLGLILIITIPLIAFKASSLISLAQDTSTLTACLNDYGAEEIFKRVMSSMAQEGDVLLAITTSGNSLNIIEALKFANSKGIYSFGFLGGNGGKALQYCNNAFIVPSEITARIQESHITAGHAMLQYIEDKLLKTGWLTMERK